MLAQTIALYGLALYRLVLYRLLCIQAGPLARSSPPTSLVTTGSAGVVN